MALLRVTASLDFLVEMPDCACANLYANDSNLARDLAADRLLGILPLGVGSAAKSGALAARAGLWAEESFSFRAYELTERRG
jgi:hypothetical protein